MAYSLSGWVVAAESAAAAVAPGGSFIVFGGLDGTGTDRSDTWLFTTASSGSSGSWALLHDGASSPAPAPRQ
jgi:hypothetical protein